MFEGVRSYWCAWQDGIIAHNRGVLRQDNPEKDPKFRLAWHRGWDLARRVQRRHDVRSQV